VPSLVQVHSFQFRIPPQKIHKSRNAAPHHFGQLELPQEILPASGRDLFDLRAALKTVANFHSNPSVARRIKPIPENKMIMAKYGQVV
jgi:hypothetical protein